MTRKETALEYHKKGYNCCQAVAYDTRAAEQCRKP